MATKRRTKARKVKAEPVEAGQGAAKEQEPGTGTQEERFDVEIFWAWCKGCGICVAFCPKEVLSMNEQNEPVVTRPELCTGCTWCELRCPDFAISVRKKEKKNAEAAESSG